MPKRMPYPVMNIRVHPMVCWNRATPTISLERNTTMTDQIKAIPKQRFRSQSLFVLMATTISQRPIVNVPVNIRYVKRGIARGLANTVLKMEDRTWRRNHQVRTPVRELGYNIAENKGEVKTIHRGRIANGMSRKKDILYSKLAYPQDEDQHFLIHFSSVLNIATGTFNITPKENAVHGSIGN